MLQQPWLAGTISLLLALVDWRLTLCAARRRASRVGRNLTGDVSYELNRFSRAAVDALIPWPRHILFASMRGALRVVVLVLLVSRFERIRDIAVGTIMGGMIFTRLRVCVSHARNIWIFSQSRMTREKPGPSGDSPVAAASGLHGLYLSMFDATEVAAILAIGSSLTGSPWLLGGALGNFYIAYVRWREFSSNPVDEDPF